jgi:hypothetical protein
MDKGKKNGKQEERNRESIKEKNEGREKQKMDKDKRK